MRTDDITEKIIKAAFKVGNTLGPGFLEKLYAYARYLVTKLPHRDGGGLLQLNGEVQLASYRNEKTFDGAGALQIGVFEPISGPGSALGHGGQPDEKKSPLSEIIQVINQHYGTDWQDDDKLLLDQISGDMAGNEDLVEQAKTNSKDQFRPVFDVEVMKAFVARQDRNEKLISQFMSNEDARKLITAALLEDMYQKVESI